MKLRTTALAALVMLSALSFSTTHASDESALKCAFLLAGIDKLDPSHQRMHPEDKAAAVEMFQDLEKHGLGNKYTSTFIRFMEKMDTSDHDEFTAAMAAGEPILLLNSLFYRNSARPEVRARAALEMATIIMTGRNYVDNVTRQAAAAPEGHFIKGYSEIAGLAWDKILSKTAVSVFPESDLKAMMVGAEKDLDFSTLLIPILKDLNQAFTGWYQQPGQKLSPAEFDLINLTSKVIVKISKQRELSLDDLDLPQYQLITEFMGHTLHLTKLDADNPTTANYLAKQIQYRHSPENKRYQQELFAASPQIQGLKQALIQYKDKSLQIEGFDESQISRIEDIEKEEAVRLMIEAMQFPLAAAFYSRVILPSPYEANKVDHLEETSAIRVLLYEYAKSRVIHLYKNHNDLFTGQRPDPQEVRDIAALLLNLSLAYKWEDPQIGAILNNPRRAVSKHLRAALQQVLPED